MSDPVARQPIRDLRRVLSVLVGIVCFLGVIPQARFQPQTKFELSVKELIVRYVAGDWSVLDLARPRLRTVQDLTRFRNDLRREIHSSPPVVVAAFALESAAAAAFEARNPRQSEDRTMLSYLVLSILEIGCEQLNGINASGAFVLHWDLASLALLQGPVTLLWGGIESPAVFNASSVAEHGHPLHVRGRFPRDPQIGLRWGISQELYVHTWLFSFGVSWSRDTPEEVLLGRSRDPHMRFHRDTELRTAAAAFEEAAQHPSQRLEAMLRLGRVRSLLGESAAALTVLREISAQHEDSDRKYLAHLFAGRTLIERGDWPNAIHEFQSALGVKPGTQSAVVPLASLLYLDDQRTEVADLIDRLLEYPATAQRDPWADYLAPGYRDWPRFIDSVRKGLR